MTRYEKTLTEANARCVQNFEDAMKHMVEQKLQDQAHQAQDDEEQDDGS